MKLVELFCGTGGFSLGAHYAGFEVAVAYDIDEILTYSHSINFPKTRLFHRDIATLSGAEILDTVDGTVTGIFGGPPCQGFSDIGRRDEKDPRRKLLSDFFRIVAEIEPAFFVMENVRGLGYPNALPVLEEALVLVQERYSVLGPEIWDASDFGAATKRNRVFIIGVRKEIAPPIARETIESFKRPAATVRAAIADLEHARALSDSEAMPGFDRWMICRRGRPSEYAKSLRAEDKVFTGHRLTAHSQSVIDRFRDLKPGQIDPVGRHPRLSWKGLCPALRAGTGADKGRYQSVRPIHPQEDRVITVREAARLQGFPDAHLFHPTVWHSFRMIGNSVSPLIAEAIFKAIRSHLGRTSATFDEEDARAQAGVPTGAYAEAAE